MEVYRRMFMYAAILYERALRRFEEGNLKKAEFAAGACCGAAVFIESDEESPSDFRKRAKELVQASESLISEIWKSQREEYGDKFMSGSKRRGSSERTAARDFTDDLRDAVKEASSS